ncbi:hypothetical protein [Epibacterium ulvae]|uniref:hypothetical protein n=1 Tax=Epibacterium ulvae TaxID=1156985 RepID=UPI0024928D74|nr:hypothetical protein [Epibacterium ulvae]
MFKEICRDEKLVLVNPFNDLRLREAKTKGSRKAVTPDMIKRILALGAMDKVNDEARDAVFICLNTGCRPSEVYVVEKRHMHLTVNVPYFEILPQGRDLKTAVSERRVVLIWVALEAMWRRHKAGGFPRYGGNHNSMTRLINKFFKITSLLMRGTRYTGCTMVLKIG